MQMKGYVKIFNPYRKNTVNCKPHYLEVSDLVKPLERLVLVLLFQTDKVWSTKSLSIIIIV